MLGTYDEALIKGNGLIDTSTRTGISQRMRNAVRESGNTGE